ncbi:WD40 repeat-like protein [Gigaspora margarita]|uniref:Ribosome biogenesis protein NSA1 n=1 Tax=Gigaspora margarita TaxID=4874 RepID=A0A8H4B4S9_GIGMA|nr:WD40 repeat-like protein [Gigaspora margarita]
MKCITGDEVGLIKAIKGLTIPNDSSSRNEATHVVETWGQVARAKGVQLMCQAKIFNEKNQIVVACNDGSIQIRDPYDQGKVCKEFKNDQVATDFVKRNKKNPAKFVGLFANNNTLMTCTTNGAVRYQPINSDDTSAIDKSITHATYLARMRVHPKENHIFACGGKERDLTVWDIHANPDSIVTQNKESRQHEGMIWNGKNVRSDFLDLRCPVWVTEIQFLNDQDYTKIVTGTRFHQIRLYDIKAQRRPVFEASIGHKMVVSIAITQSQNEIIFSDTIGNIFTCDLRTGRNLGQYKGFPKGSNGCVTDLTIHHNSSSLVSASADQHLHVHKLGEFREEKRKILLNHKLKCVLVEDDDVPDVPDVPEVEETADLDDIRPKPKKRKTKK